MKYLHIENGKLEERESSLTLADCQAKVGGGYIEGFRTIDGELEGTSIALYCNEDGYRKGLEPNVRFPEVLTVYGWMLGPVIIVGLNEEGETRSLTPQEMTWFTIEAQTLKVEPLYEEAGIHGVCPKCGGAQLEGKGCTNDECSLFGAFV